MGNNLLQTQKLVIKAFLNTMEGRSLPKSCCDQQIIKAEKGHPVIPKESLLFPPMFIDNNIWIFPHQYEVSLRECFDNKGFTEKKKKKTPKKPHPKPTKPEW